MNGKILPSSQYQLEDQVLSYAQDQAHGTVSFAVREDGKENDLEEITPERKHAIFMRAFAGHLNAEGLRSPQYYDDKSQCLSFHENASPAEMAYLKARNLKYGYIEPDDLISRLRLLKPSDNFTLRKYRHPRMQWDKSPITEESYVLQPPDSDWFWDQLGGIWDMRRQLGKRHTEYYQQEARDRWDQVCDIELTPLPDLHLLRDMGRSPSGTLFPRYLVKGLNELRERANDRGGKYYDEEYEEAKVKRREIIHRWQDENPDSILADGPVSIYRAWPSELMDQLDAVDQEAMRRGSECYMTNLRETEKKMQALVTFWRDCGLVTGQRTPPSPQLPDPKAKLRGKYWPDYLTDKLDRLRVEFQQSRNSKEYEKRRFIEITRWKEAVLNADSEPSASDTPFPQSLMDELDVVWQGYDFLEPEETEDEMIKRIVRWRKSKPKKPQLDRSQTPSPLNPNVSTSEIVGKTSSDSTIKHDWSYEDGEGMRWTHQCSPSVSESHKSIDFKLHKKQTTPPTDPSSVTDTIDENAGSATFRPSQTSKPGNSLRLLNTQSKKLQLRSQESGIDIEAVALKSAWWGRLRPRKEALELSKGPAGKPPGIVKRGAGKTPKKMQQPAMKGNMDTPSEQKPVSLNASSSQYIFEAMALQAMLVSAKDGRTKRLRHLSEPSRVAQPQGVRKACNSRSKTCKARGRGSDKPS